MTKQLDELSKGTLTNYVTKAGANRQLHSAKAGLAMTRANSPRGEAEVKSSHAKNSQKHALKAYNRAVGIQRAMKKLGEEVDLNEDGLERIGSYKNKAGHHFTMHRSPKDPKHMLLVHKGRVVDYHHGTPAEFHKKITKGSTGLTGYNMHEDLEVKSIKDNEIVLSDPKNDEVKELKKSKNLDGVMERVSKAIREQTQLDEISKKLAASYIDNAKHSVSAHAGWSGYEARGEADRGDKKPTKLRKYHDHKLTNRQVGISRALDTLTKEETQIDEVSSKTLDGYEEASGKSFHTATNKGDKNTLRKRRAGAKSLAKRANTCSECGGSGVEHGHSSSDGNVPCKSCDGRGHVFEETQQIVEISKPTLRSYVHKAMDDIDVKHDSAMKEFKATGKARKYVNRQRGVAKAIDKLVKEEQIDELSRDTLKNYMFKSGVSKKHHEFMADAHDDIAHSFRSVPSHKTKHEALGRKHDSIAKKRERGRDMAANSLSKIHPRKDGLAKIKSHVNEEIKKKGRPKKARHEDGEIVNDPKA